MMNASMGKPSARAQEYQDGGEDGRVSISRRQTKQRARNNYAAATTVFARKQEAWIENQQ